MEDNYLNVEEEYLHFKKEKKKKKGRGLLVRNFFGVDFPRVVVESIFCKIIFGNHSVRCHKDIPFFIRNKN